MDDIDMFNAIQERVAKAKRDAAKDAKPEPEPLLGVI